jgi:Uncharacterized conserved protein (COG2071)
MQTSFHGPFRPPLLPVPMGVELQGYTLINWAIPPERLKGLLPPLFVPVTTVQEGRPVAWFSIFVGLNVLKGVGPLPALIPYQFPQLNYRTYVKHQTGHGLYFLRSVVGDPLAALGLRTLTGFPADTRSFSYEPVLRGDVLDRVDVQVGDNGSEVDLAIESTGRAPETPGFASASDAVHFLGNVPEGAFSRGGGRYGVMISAHPPLTPLGGRLLHGRFTWPVEHGLLTAEEAARPDSIFMQGRAPFPTYV